MSGFLVLPLANGIYAKLPVRPRSRWGGSRIPGKPSWLTKRPLWLVERQRLEGSLRGQARTYGFCVWPQDPGMLADPCRRELARELAVHPIEMQRLAISLREQARSHGFCVWPQNPGMPGGPCRRALARELALHPIEMQLLAISLREQARFHGFCVWPKNPGMPRDPCRSELARELAVQPIERQRLAISLPGKRAPTGCVSGRRIRECPLPICRSELARELAVHPIEMQRLAISLPGKRAPTGFVSGRKIRECPQIRVGVSLLAIGCAAVAKPAAASCLTHRMHRFCCRSPADRPSAAQSASLRVLCLAAGSGYACYLFVGVSLLTKRPVSPVESQRCKVFCRTIYTVTSAALISMKPRAHTSGTSQQENPMLSHISPIA